MRPFLALSARVCPLPIANIDTDQLIPARFMRRPRADGYGRFLLHDLRFEADGSERASCPLNEPVHKGAEILIAGRNFGCGSSREAAVYALVDHGIRVVIAPSFGDIFASNAVKNGLLPARIAEADLDALLEAGRLVADRPFAVDLEHQTITAGNLVLPFAIDPVWKQQLLMGWDDIDLTLSHVDKIEAFGRQDRERRPWANPVTI